MDFLLSKKKEERKKTTEIGTMQHYVVYVRNERKANRTSARYHAVAGLLLVAVVVALASARYAVLPL